MEQDESASAADRAVLLIFEGISLAFFFAPTEALINGGANYGLYIFGYAIGVALSVAGVKWRSWKDRIGAELSSSLIRLANDARVWLALISVAWIYSVTPDLLLFARGEPTFLTLSRQVAAMRTDMDRYVLPRHLTPEQSSIISTYLKAHEPQQFGFVMVKNDRESDEYRAEIETTLLNGGWTMPESGGIAYDDVLEGLGVQLRGNQSSDRKRPDAEHIIERAFRKAKVEIVSSSSGGETVAPPLLISIGRRRRDDQGIVPQPVTDNQGEDD